MIDEIESTPPVARGVVVGKLAPAREVGLAREHVGQQVERRDPDAEHEPEIAIVRHEDVAAAHERHRGAGLQRLRGPSLPSANGILPWRFSWKPRLSSWRCSSMFHSIAMSCSSVSPPRSSAARAVTVFAIAHLFIERARRYSAREGPFAASRTVGTHAGTRSDPARRDGPRAPPSARQPGALDGGVRYGALRRRDARYIRPRRGAHEDRQDRRAGDAGGRPAGTGDAAARRYGRAADPRDQRRRLRLRRARA